MMCLKCAQVPDLVPGDSTPTTYFSIFLLMVMEAVYLLYVCGILFSK